MKNAKPTPDLLVFYSRKDEKFRGELEIHLKGLGLHSDQAMDWWSDARLVPGSLWKDELLAALGSCRIALLLVSKGFLSSDFIAREELPLIFDRVNKGDGLKIFWILLSPCAWEYTPISKYTALYKEAKFADMHEHTRDAIWTSIVRKIQEQLEKLLEKIPRLQRNDDLFWSDGQDICLDLALLRYWFDSYDFGRPKISQNCILALREIVKKRVAGEEILILNMNTPLPWDLQIEDDHITAWIDFEILTAHLYPQFRDVHLVLLLHNKSMNIDSGKDQQLDRHYLNLVLCRLLIEQIDYDKKLDKLAVLSENHDDFVKFSRYHSSLLLYHLAILWAVETKVFTENNSENEQLHWLFLSTRLCEQVCYGLLEANFCASQTEQSHHKMSTTGSSSLNRRPEGT